MPNLSSAIRDIESIVHRNDHSRIDELIGWLSAGKMGVDIDDWLGNRDATTDDRLAWAAAWALGSLGVERAVPALEELLGRYKYNSTPGAAVALLRIGPDKVRKRTITTIIRKWGPLRVGLGGIRHRRPDLVPFVKPFCGFFHPRIRKEARTFVQANEGPEKLPEKLMSASPSVIATWLKELDTEDQEVVDQVALKLAKCESLPLEAGAVLREALAKASDCLQYDPRCLLAIALARTGDSAAMVPLLEMLDTLDLRSVAGRAIEILLTASAAKIPSDALAHLLEYPEIILCIWANYDMHWTCEKNTLEVDLKPIKALAAAELMRRAEVSS